MKSKFLIPLVVLFAMSTSLFAGNANSKDQKGSVAVLPFKVVSNEQGLNPEELGRQIQETVAGQLMSTNSYLEVQDAATTVAILAKNNLVHDDDRLALTPAELAKLLGVQYVVSGTYNIINKGAHTSGSEVSTYKDQGKKSDNKRKGSEITTQSSNTRISYDSKMSMKIIDDSGKTIYFDTKTPMVSGIDDYNGLIKRLLKKSPFGGK